MKEVQKALLDFASVLGGGELTGPLASLKLANAKMRQIIAKLQTAA